MSNRESIAPCTKCGRYDFDQDESTIVCRSCGHVVSESNITSDITFVDGSDGSVNVIGQFVSDSGLGGAHRHSKIPGQRTREATFSNGRRRISQVANALKLGSQQIDAAYRFFMLAIQHNFTQGRKTQNVIAACLYIACRRFKTAHMLIDFSDVLQTNVYTLGNTFLKLCQVLNINPPLVDPSLYIYRFAAQLEFEEKETEVANTALRLVQRMKRDWIQTGRRPAGICGAALLIAARIHGFKRSQKEIIQIVKICDLTLRRRLNEFDKTPSSALTPAEFELIDSDKRCLSECDPPAFNSEKANHKKKRFPTTLFKYQSAVKAFFPTSPGSQPTSAIRNKIASSVLPLDISKFVCLENQVHLTPHASSDDEETIEKDLREALLDGQKFQNVDSATLNRPHLPPLEELGGCFTKPLAGEDANADHLAANVHENPSLNDDIENVSFDDIKMYLLSPEEVKVKGIIWDQLNKDYLLALADKEKMTKSVKTASSNSSSKRRNSSKEPSQIESLRKQERSSMINWAAVTLQNLVRSNNSNHTTAASDDLKLSNSISSVLHFDTHDSREFDSKKMFASTPVISSQNSLKTSLIG